MSTSAKPQHTTETWVPDPGEESSLKEAKAWLRQRLDKGVACPCCTRLAKVYKRGLSSGKAVALIQLYKITQAQSPPNGWLHVSREMLAAGMNANSMEYSKLQHWKLLEPYPATSDRKDPERLGAGYWRLTPRGILFVQEKCKVPKYILVYDQRCIGYEDPRIDIREARSTKFNYQELMS